MAQEPVGTEALVKLWMLYFPLNSNPACSLFLLRREFNRGCSRAKGGFESFWIGDMSDVGIAVGGGNCFVE